MNFINNSFWLTDKSHIQFTPIAKRNKINAVKTGQNLMHRIGWECRPREMNIKRKTVPTYRNGPLEVEFNRGLLPVLQLLQVSE